MAQSTSYDLPNYVGNLFLKSERPNAFLKLVGGLQGIVNVSHWEFPMGNFYTLAAPSQPAILEGAAATASQVALTQASNVVQIFQEQVDLTYSKQASRSLISGVTVAPGGAAGPLQVPGTLEWQIARKMEKIQQDSNYTLLRGAYQKPADNTTARKTRGVRTAVSTNVSAAGSVPLTKTIFESALATFVGNGMFNAGDRIVAMAGAAQFSALIGVYESATVIPQSREEAGVMIRTIHNKWATVDVVYEPDVASGEIFLTRPEKCRVIGMPIPGKGLFFVEPMAKVGSSDQAQVYGEIGVDYTNEIFHGAITGLT